MINQGNESGFPYSSYSEFGIEILKGLGISLIIIIVFIVLVLIGNKYLWSDKDGKR